MKITELSLKHNKFVIVLFVLFVFSGVFSYLEMPKSEDPILVLPNYAIHVVYPGTSVEDMESLIVNPIEEAINELDNIDKTSSTIKEGLVKIDIEGSFEVDPLIQFDKLVSKIENIKGELPKDLYALKVFKVNPTIMTQLAIFSDSDDYNKICNYTEKLKSKLSYVKGVRAVDIEANPEEVIEIRVDLNKMSQMNISLNQLIKVLKGNNINIPGGDIDIGNKNFNIKTSGGYKSLQSILFTVIDAKNGDPIYLKDVASVEKKFNKRNHIGRYNGKNALYLTISPKYGVNILSLDKKINSIISDFISVNSKDVHLEVSFSQVPFVKSRISSFFTNLFQGILLLGGIIIIFLGRRSSFIIITIIPLSILIAISILKVAGYGIHQISLVGLVIALGLLVDNAIVVVENILHYLEEGYSKLEAVTKGTKEVGPSIISSTLTTILAFYPLTQIEGSAGQFLKSMPLTVIFAMIASLILALSLTPILCVKFLSEKGESNGNFLKKGLDLFSETIYNRILNFSLAKPFVVIGLSVVFLIGSCLLFPKVGVSFFPNADKPLLLINVDTPNGSSLKETDKAVRYVESILDTSSFVKNISSNTGKSNPYIFYNRKVKQLTKSHGQIMVNLKQWDPNKFYYLISDLRKHFNKYSGAKITVEELKNGPSVEAPIAIKILGENLDSIKFVSAEIEKLISNEPGVINVVNPLAKNRINLKIEINKEKSSALGVLISDIDLIVRTQVVGFEIDKVILNNNNYKLMLKPKDDLGSSIETLESILVTSNKGESIPLSQLVKIKFEESISQIGHFKNRRNNTIFAGVLNSDKTISITQKLIKKIKNINVPEEIEFYIAGEYEKQNKSFGSMGRNLIIALISIFAILVFQFKSTAQPFIILTSIPFAFIGSIIALYITGWSFSFFAFVGLTSLVGIVINDSIVLIDFANGLIKKGVSVENAIKEAAKKRFNPIILTTLTTIIGLIPLSLNLSGLWSPLVWTIIGGMISSTVLILIVVPVLFKLYSKPKKRF